MRSAGMTEDPPAPLVPRSLRRGHLNRRNLRWNDGEARTHIPKPPLIPKAGACVGPTGVAGVGPAGTGVARVREHDLVIERAAFAGMSGRKWEWQGQGGAPTRYAPPPGG